MYRVALLLPIVLCVGMPPAAAQSPALTLEDVQEAYEAIEGLEASFTQVLSSDFAGDSTQISGSVLLSGNKYRVRTPQQTIVTNGTTTWIYTPADSQVVVNDAGDRRQAVTPETFLTASAERYTVDATSSVRRLGAPHLRLDVVAADSSARFAEASLWVRRSDRIVTRMRARDRNGSVLDLRLRNLTVNPETLRERTPFEFSPPSGVEVIDLRRSE